MKTKLFVVSVLVVLLLSVAAIPAAAQGKYAVLVNGTASIGNPKFISGYVGPAQLNDMKISPGFGGEVRFGQNGRATFGLGYQSWRASSSLRDAAAQCSACLRTDKARANEVTGTLYINLVKRGPVRPFVGGGGGVAMVKNDDTLKWDSGRTELKSSSAVVPTIKALGGVNIFPTKHVILSLGGGYINGRAATFGAGFTF